MLIMMYSLTVSRAQQAGAPPDSPGQASSGALSQESSQSTVNNPENLEGTVPNVEPMTPLSGARDFFYPGGGRTYAIPAFHWTGLADTNANSAPGTSRLETRSIFLGSLDLRQVQTRTRTNLDYAGGAFFYSRTLRQNSSTAPPPYGTLHSLDFMENVYWRRWQLLLGDQLLYLPESPFGFSGFGSLSSFGGGLGGASLGNGPTINPTLLPDQAILTGNGQRLSNTAIAEVQYAAGARSMITVTGFYGLLHFFESGFIDSRYAGLLAGYNYQLSRRGQISIFYLDYLYRFDVANRQVLARGFQLAYGRRFTSRLFMKLSGGPVAIQVSQPVGGVVTRPFWSTYDSLRYRTVRNDISLSFIRHVGGGSGVLYGSESDIARLTIGRQISRAFHGSVNFGHAYNQSLTQQASLPLLIPSNTQRRTRYEVWEAGVNLSRSLGEHVSMSLTYRAQRQISNQTFCFRNNCGARFFRQVGGVGISWHGRPIKLR